MPVRLSDFDYTLPPERVAQQPAACREQSRLMVLRRATGEYGHHRFSDLPNLLQPGDLLVLNDTKVIPARFFCRRDSGGRVEGLFLRAPRTQESDSHGGQADWMVLLRNAGRCRLAERLAFEDGEGQALELLENYGRGQWRVRPIPAGRAEDILHRVGRTPLPPYIRRPDVQQDSADRQRYQAVYADRPGAVAAPTAGLHFTHELLGELAQRGLETAAVTLHVGLGTFAPVQHETLADHPMHAEYFEFSAGAAEKINTAKSQGRRIVAVGTTSVRVLESVAARQMGESPRLAPAEGWTDLFLYPPADFRVADAMITNFHLPKSTLLMLAAAFCDPGGAGGIATILAAYAEAVRRKYRFYSYGDAMLIV